MTRKAAPAGIHLGVCSDYLIFLAHPSSVVSGSHCTPTSSPAAPRPQLKKTKKKKTHGVSCQSNHTFNLGELGYCFHKRPHRGGHKTEREQDPLLCNLIRAGCQSRRTMMGRECCERYSSKACSLFTLGFSCFCWLAQPFCYLSLFSSSLPFSARKSLKRTGDLSNPIFFAHEQ